MTRPEMPRQPLVPEPISVLAAFTADRADQG
jgi:hypothetical protein